MAFSFKSGEAVLVETSQGGPVAGLVYAFDAQSQLLVLQVPSKKDQLEFRMVSAKAITKSGQAPSEVIDKRLIPAKFPAFDIEKAKEREKEAVIKAKNAAAKIGKGVTREAQVLFNAIERIYNQTQWDGHRIVVMGQVVIDPPYASAKLLDASKGQSLLKLVQNIIEKKMNPN